MVHNDGRPQRVALAYALATLAGLLVLWVALDNLAEERFAVFEHQQVAAYVDTLSASLSVSLNEKISLITGLHAYVKAEIDERGNLVNTETEAFAAELYHSSQDIRNIAIGPGGVMRFVYPYAANQSVVGYEPAQDPRPEVRAEVQRAIDSRDVVLSLPYALIQGGLGMIVRRAVYVEDSYWGLVNIVIDVPALLQEAGLEPPPAGLALALRDQAGQVFWGDESVFASAPATHRIPLPEGAWELAAAPVQGWQSRNRGVLWFYRILGLLVVGILPLTVYLSINRRERLALLVDRRTQELNTANRELEQQIGERVQAQAALRRAAQEWQATFDSVTDALCLIDAEQRIVRTNRAMEEMFPGHRGDMVGKPCWEVVHGAAEPIAGCPLMRMWRTWQRESIEFPIGERIFEITVDPIVDDTGKPTGAVHAMRDITRRRTDEKRLQTYTERLEAMVAERTAGLETALAEMESFSYSVSHDLRSPLRGIDGWSLALLEDYGDRLDAQGRRYLDRVRTQAQHMGELIDDLLELARVSRVPMQQDVVDLTALVQAIAAQLTEDQPQRPVEWTIQEGLAAQGDAALLRIALTNLLGNAWKFSGPRDPARIEFGQTEVEGRLVYFVRDNGVGFDMAHAAKLFRPFQRLHSSVEFSGTGIGLATVQRIVQRHGGRVWAEAEPDRGATFYFTIEE